MSERNKVWLEFLYRALTTLIVFNLLCLVALVVVVGLYPHDQAKQNIVGCIWVGSGVLTIGSMFASRRLRLSHFVETGSYSLPYTMRRGDTLKVMVAGFVALHVMGIPTWLRGQPFTFATSKGGPPVFSMPLWVAWVLIIWLPFGLILFFIASQGLIVYSDHLVYKSYRTSRALFFHEIQSVAIESRYRGRGGRQYVVVFQHHGQGPQPLEIDLGFFAHKGWVVLLKTLDEANPQVALNPLAEQLKKGQFPILA